MKTYTSSGLVYGKTWGGGFGAYEAEKLSSNNENDLIREAKKLLKTGGLDSGMGFEYLKGALLDIKEKEIIKKGKKEYWRFNYKTKFIGDLTEADKDFLLGVCMN